MSFWIIFTLFVSPQLEPCHYFGVITGPCCLQSNYLPVFFDLVFIDATPLFDLSLPTHFFTLAVTDIHTFCKFFILILKVFLCIGFIG